MKKCIEITMWSKKLSYDYLHLINNLANSLGIKGSAFFRNDGSIKIIAEEEEKLNILTKKLKRGRFFLFFFSPMENFSIKWCEVKNDFENFSINETTE